MTDEEVVFEDDPSIETDDPIWRRISPGRWTFDHNEGRVRPMSGLFQYSRDKKTGKKHPMSVTLGKGLTPDAAVAGHGAGIKLVAWNAGYLRGLALGVCPDGQPDAVAHGLVFTLELDSAGDRKTSISSPVREALSLSAEWLIPLSPEEIEEARLRTAD